MKLLLHHPLNLKSFHNLVSQLIDVEVGAIPRDGNLGDNTGGEANFLLSRSHKAYIHTFVCTRDE